MFIRFASYRTLSHVRGLRDRSSGNASRSLITIVGGVPIVGVAAAALLNESSAAVLHVAQLPDEPRLLSQVLWCCFSDARTAPDAIARAQIPVSSFSYDVFASGKFDSLLSDCPRETRFYSDFIGDLDLSCARRED